MKLGMSSNAGAIAQKLQKLASSDLPYVTTLALNDTAKDALPEIQEHMDDVFDQPTRFTRSAFFIWYANKRTLTAEIKRKTMQSKRHYMEVQAKGGSRPMAGFERALKASGQGASQIRTVTPAAGAKKDRFGNWTRGQRNQVFKGLAAQASASPAGAGGSPKKKGVGYFVAPPNGALSPGVYRRERTGELTKLLHFSKRSARYSKSFTPFEVVEDVVARRYADHFRKRLTEVLRKGP